LKVTKKIFLAGHDGMVGKALLSHLQKSENILITAPRQELDLSNQSEVNNFFQKNKIDEVFISAAKVGGILANQTRPADFIFNNILIQSNIINAAHQCNINKLLFFGSSCIYPAQSYQPIKESQLLTGPLEETNRAYAIAKISGIEMCRSFNIQYHRDYRCIMPTNLYGPNDNFDQHHSHVVPSLISKFHEASINKSDSVIVWGSGSPLREFMHVDDLARAAVNLMNFSSDQYRDLIDNDEVFHINVGSGEEISIKDLAILIADITKFKGKILFDENYPDGMSKKLLDLSILNRSGFKVKYDFQNGLKHTYDWYKKNIADTIS
jgi:GDP-L-fucose synthase